MERYEKIVVDASIVVKWFAPEKEFEKALKLRDKYLEGLTKLAAPRLLLYEVANALRFHRVYRFSEEHMVEAVESVVDLGIIVEEDPPVWRRAIELSYETGISVYDAVYVALAMNRRALFVTSDKQLYSKLKGKTSIALLSEVD